jgi:tRNA(Ile)-lysidine synthase
MDRLTASAGPRQKTIWPGAVAVSGGGDSIALMHLLADWAKARKLTPPVVLSVDHGLRPSSAKEAKQVARWAKALDLKSHILTAKGIARTPISKLRPAGSGFP